MAKIWFLFINGLQEGPFSHLELSRDERLGPEVYAWKEGMADWEQIGKIPELKSLVEKEDEPGENDLHEDKEESYPDDDELVMEMQKGWHFPFLWLVVLLIILLYTAYKIFWP